jgi:putative transposase
MHGFEREDDKATCHSTLTGWEATGKRTKRGLYRTAQNWYINADCNGAANILRKVSITLGLDLSGVSRGALTRPTRISFWVTAKKTLIGTALASL